MARVTIEDSLLKAKNKFALVVLASDRAKQLAKGEYKPLVEAKNRPVVVALREIAAGKVGYEHPELLHRDSDAGSIQFDDMEFTDDDEEGE
ncbi:MAG: DNA-directed RNA polymerase subunit omega [Deltaproteobacteria bacterium]|nr:DNA-directed RNA polymerase subunit omega [Deltaproteobacteria bacterium]